jgi:hypothetical protein
MEEIKNQVRQKNVVIVKDTIIKQVSTPSTIQRVAIDKGINPQEVYVRVTFEYGGKEFGVSNKLRFLTKAGYEELIKAKENKTVMTLAVDTESGFFYIEKDIKVDDLFKTPIEKKTDTRTGLSALIV